MGRLWSCSVGCWVLSVGCWMKDFEFWAVPAVVCVDVNARVHDVAKAGFEIRILLRLVVE